MSYLRVLNVIAFILLELAFFTVAGKLNASRELNRQLETALQERQSEDNQSLAAYGKTVEAAQQIVLRKGK